MDPGKDSNTTSEAPSGGLLGLGSNTLSAKREPLNDLHTENHFNESQGIHIDID